MRKKNGFTLPEMLFACTMLAVITLSSVLAIKVTSHLLFTGQTETENRTNLSETLFYLTREIQSAEVVRISKSGKKLEIKLHGSSRYNICYEIKSGYPNGALYFKEKRLLDINYESSKFEITGGRIMITFSVVNNNTDVNSRGKNMITEAVPRTEAVIINE